MAMFKKTKMQDTLEQKEAKLAFLNQKSTNAVRLVRATLDGLQSVDEEISQTLSEIEEIQTRMSNTKAGLEERRSKNQQIMQNFKSLLCEE